MQLAYWKGRFGDERVRVALSPLARTAQACAAAFASLGAPSGAAVAKSRQIACMAALCLTLREFGEDRPGHVLSTTSNRRSAEDMEIVGCLYRHVIWTPPVGRDRLNNLCGQLFSQGLRHYQNIDVTFDQILDECERSYGAFPFMEYAFTYRDMTLFAAHGHERIIPLPHDVAAIEQRLPIHLHVSFDGAEETAVLTYHKTWRHANVAADFLVRFRRNLTEVVS